MILLDPLALTAIAAIITSASTLVWSFRRKP